MKLKYLLLIFCLSCQTPIKRDVIKQDSIKLSLADTLISKLTREYIKALESKDSTIIHKNSGIKFLLKDVKKYQGNELELLKIETKLIILQKDNKLYTDSILLENNYIKNKNEVLKKAIISEKNVSKKAIEDKNKILKSIKPTISKFKINAYAFNGGFFRNKKVESDLAKDVKRVEIRFIVSPNKLDEEKSHIISVILNENTKSFTYKQEIDKESFTSYDKNFISGDESIVVTIDNEIIITKTLTLN